MCLFVHRHYWPHPSPSPARRVREEFASLWRAFILLCCYGGVEPLSVNKIAAMPKLLCFLVLREESPLFDKNRRPKTLFREKNGRSRLRTISLSSIEGMSNPCQFYPKAPIYGKPFEDAHKQGALEIERSQKNAKPRSNILLTHSRPAGKMPDRRF